MVFQGRLKESRKSSKLKSKSITKKALLFHGLLESLILCLLVICSGSLQEKNIKSLQQKSTIERLKVSFENEIADIAILKLGLD